MQIMRTQRLLTGFAVAILMEMQKSKKRPLDNQLILGFCFRGGTPRFEKNYVWPQIREHYLQNMSL